MAVLALWLQAAGTIWLTGPAGPIGREARVVIRATDITLAKTRPRNLSVRTTLAGTVAGIEADDEGPLAGGCIDLDGHGHLFALATRKAIDERAYRGDRVFALVKSVALDERARSARVSLDAALKRRRFSATTPAVRRLLVRARCRPSRLLASADSVAYAPRLANSGTQPSAGAAAGLVPSELIFKTESRSLCPRPESPHSAFNSLSALSAALSARLFGSVDVIQLFR